MFKIMSPAQCRGARALLDLTQPELAAKAGVGLSTIVDFERKRRRVSDHVIEVLRETFERAGIEFIDENGGGPGVRLRKRGRPKPAK
jgi:transcriptional regulator with XRE-family HTH domain